MAIINLGHLSAYALTLSGLQDYYYRSTPGDKPYAAFPQAYKYKKKKNNKEYRKTGYPNAWINQENTYLDLSAIAGDQAKGLPVKTIFEDKDEQTLKYLWQWIQVSGTEAEKDSGDQDGNYGKYDALMHHPDEYNEKVSGYNYGSNMKKFEITNFEPASITTTGLQNINTQNLNAYGIDENGNITGEFPTINWDTHVTEGDFAVDSNWQPTEAPSVEAPDGSIYQTSITTPVFGNAELLFYMGGSMSSSVGFSSTTGSSTTTSNGTSQDNMFGIGFEAGQAAGDEGGWQFMGSASFEHAWGKTWERVDYVSFSETISSVQGVEIESGFSVTINPGISIYVEQTTGDSQYSGESNDDYIIEAGDTVYIAVQASEGSYNNEFAIPWIYTDSVQDVVLGSNTPNNSTTLLPHTKKLGGKVRSGYPYATARTLSNQIGIIGQYGLDYDYFDVVMNSPSSSSLIEVQGNNLLVNGATSANTIVVSDYEVIIAITPPSNSASAKMRSAKELNIKKKFKQSIKDDNIKTMLTPKMISKRNYSILDLNQIRQDRVRLAKDEGRAPNSPGYYITKENDKKGQVIILSTENNIVDLQKSKHDQSIIAIGKKDRIALGNGNDLVDTSGAKGYASAYTGDGNDTVYSGKGDYISTSKGNDQIIALAQSYIDSGEGKDNIAFKNKAMARVSNFQPGNDILQKFTANKKEKLLDGRNFNLSEIATSRGRTYMVADKKGRAAGIISLDDKHLMSNDNAKLNLALRQKDFSIDADDLLIGYFDSKFKEKIGNKAKELFENKGFADRTLYYHADNKKHRREFIANLQEIMEFVYDRNNVKAAIQSASEQNNWEGNNYPWLNIFESSIEILADL